MIFKMMKLLPYLKISLNKAYKNDYTLKIRAKANRKFSYCKSNKNFNKIILKEKCF